MEMTPPSVSQTGRRAVVLLLAAWLGPLVFSATMLGERAAAESWEPAPVPAFCDALPFSFDVQVDEAPPPLPPECEPGVPPKWVDVLHTVTRFSEELISLAVAAGLALMVAVVVMTRRERAVDAKARLAFRLGLVSLALVLGVLVIAGALLLVAVASFPIRG